MITKLTEEQNKVLSDRCENFKGQITTLSAALGAIHVGHIYGWRVLKIIHSPATLKKYEQIIGLKYEEICPETTENSMRNVGYRVSQKIGAFWKVVLGQVKVENKNEANDDKE
jgi:hypothetical protein